jgi:FtsP/CotA-like multicopper oxidase with cupredoxin domain
MSMTRHWKPRRSDRVVIGIVASLAVLVPLGWAWANSLVPDTYSVMGMGVPDYGGGPADAGHTAHALGSAGPAPQAGDQPVTELAGPRSGQADVAVTLVARQETLTLASGERVAGYTLNHTSPGPLIRVRQGELVQVTLVNDSVPDGVSLHWHGVNVPNAEDGVAGVTQDAVPPGGRHVYRFLASDPGTFWYHSHQVSHQQVRGGLFGVLVVDWASADKKRDLVAAVHTYDQLRTVNGATGQTQATAAPGQPVRVRVVNTNSAPVDAQVVGAAFRVLAVDGRDLIGPSPVEGKALQVPAGGRADLGFVTPTDGGAARVQFGDDDRTSLVVGPDGAQAPEKVAASEQVDLLSYGTHAPLGFDPNDPDRRFDYSIGRRPGFLDGIPGLHWSINGHLFPDVPMFMVTEGDTVVMTIENHSGKIHPMHLHGHHAVVLSRNGAPATGSPWWVDSLDVAPGDSYEVSFTADNPGIWLDHCHNLPHAAQGMIAHLAYTGITTPYLIGGPANNEPE